MIDDDRREQHAYACHAGPKCMGDGTFEAAAPEWFEDRKLSLPKWCDDCKNWFKEQEGEGDRLLSREPERRVYPLKKRGKNSQRGRSGWSGGAKELAHG